MGYIQRHGHVVNVRLLIQLWVRCVGLGYFTNTYSIFRVSSSFLIPHVICWSLDNLIPKLDFSFSSFTEKNYLDCSCIFQQEIHNRTLLMERINDVVDNPKCCWPTPSPKDTTSTLRNEGSETSCSSVFDSSPSASPFPHPA
jgi:hypothetical protein